MVASGGAYGKCVFYVPPTSHYLGLEMIMPIDESEWHDWQARFFGVADNFLNELGWVD